MQEKDSDRCILRDVAIPSDYNIQKKAIENISKDTDLQIDFQRMWFKKAEVITIIIETMKSLKRTSRSAFGKYHTITTSTTYRDQQSYLQPTYSFLAFKCNWK